MNGTANKSLVAALVAGLCQYIALHFFSIQISGEGQVLIVSVVTALITWVPTWLTKNKVTAQQTKEVLATVGVTPAQAAMGVTVVPAPTGGDISAFGDHPYVRSFGDPRI